MRDRPQATHTRRHYNSAPRSTRQPDTPVLRLYKDLSAWHKPFLTLSPAQQSLVVEILEQRFPGIEIQARNLRNAQIVGILKAVGFMAVVLVILVLIVIIGGPGL